MIFLAPIKIDVLKANGIVNAGNPYGNRIVSTLAISNTVKIEPIVAVRGAIQLSPPRNTTPTANAVKMAL